MLRQLPQFLVTYLWPYALVPPKESLEVEETARKKKRYVMIYVYLYENNSILTFNGRDITDTLSYLEYYILQSTFSSSLLHLIHSIMLSQNKCNCIISVWKTRILNHKKVSWLPIRPTLQINKFQVLSLYTSPVALKYDP